MAGLDEPGGKRECFIFALVETFAPVPLFHGKKDIQGEAAFADIPLP
jgi:hypothetical protein